MPNGTDSVTLEMSVEPARQPGEDGARTKATIFTRAVSMPNASATRAPPFRARIARQAGCRAGCSTPDDGQHHAPDQIIIVAAAGERVTADPHRRNTGQPIIFAEPVERAEQVIEADAPGDGSERQVMPGQTQGDGADRPAASPVRAKATAGSARRDAVGGGEDRGGIGAEATNAAWPNEVSPPTPVSRTKPGRRCYRALNRPADPFRHGRNDHCRRSGSIASSPWASFC